MFLIIKYLDLILEIKKTIFIALNVYVGFTTVHKVQKDNNVHYAIISDTITKPVKGGKNLAAVNNL